MNFEDSIFSRIFKYYIYIVLCLFLSSMAKAQINEDKQNTYWILKGRVLDKDSLFPIDGAAIRVNNITSVTGKDGFFSLKMSGKKSNIITVSYVGYNLLSIPVSETDSTLLLLLEKKSQNLQDVVVTALGIKREGKALGYSIQQINGEQVNTAVEPNVMNSLSGKVAGLQMYQGSGGPAGSSQIIIRGFNSITGGNNEPLIVIDGMPLSNSQTSSSTTAWGGQDQGVDLSMINPEDIESMSVLKGPAAAALYGTRGGNGVILITTKKGKAGQSMINVTSNASFEKPLVTYDFQNGYGQGSSGQFSNATLMSWGPKITGQTVTDWTGKETSLKADVNGYKNFLQTGTTFNNSVDFSGGANNISYRLAYNRFDNTSMQPNYGLKRDNITGRINFKTLNDKLSIDGKLTYVNQYVKNRPYSAGSTDNIYYGFITQPRSVLLSTLNPSYDSTGYPVTYYPNTMNPYWSVDKMKNNDQNTKYLSVLSLEYQINSWLKVMGRHSLNYTKVFTEVKTPMHTPTSLLTNQGSYSFSGYDLKEENMDFLVTAKKSLGDFNITLNGGGNQMKYSNIANGASTTGLLVDGLWNISNSPDQATFTQNTYKKKINSLYAFANISYLDFLFLDVTFRNDWSSTLAKDNRSFNYPSFSGSIDVIKGLDKLKVQLPSYISSLNLRGAWAKAGNDRDPYGTASTYTLATVPGSTAIGTQLPVTKPNYELKPEINKTMEFGANVGVLNDRLSVDFTWYKKNSYNQIISLNTSATTGYSTSLINAGNVQNKGIEMIIKAIPIRTNDFQWTATFNFNKNTNKMVSLSPDQKSAILFSYGDGYVYSYVEEGGKYGDIYGIDFQRNSNGKIIVDATGLPVENSGVYTKLGNFQPKWIGGLQNSFKYKNWAMSFLIDMKIGGQFYSGSLATMYAYGSAAGTVPYREGGLVVDGVTEDGSANTVAVDAESYWKRVAGTTGSGISKAFVYDATNIRLREFTLMYQLLKNQNHSALKNLSIGLVGRNLFFLNKHVNGIDPETGMSSLASGFEYAGMPSSRSIGMTLRFGF